jgi:uncharacterized phiE125 gp8 family phage protein
MQHTRLMSVADSNLVQIYAQVATDLIEGYLGRYLLNRSVTWTAANDSQFTSGWNATLTPWAWSSFIAQPVLTLPRPASAIASVTVGLWGQPDVVLVQDADYNVDYLSAEARLRWISNGFNNTTKDHLVVVFTSGYGTTQAQIPSPILHAIALTTVALYENRGDTMPDLLSTAVMALLGNYRFFAFG